jgi:hypothetical protein
MSQVSWLAQVVGVFFGASASASDAMRPVVPAEHGGGPASTGGRVIAGFAWLRQPGPLGGEVAL